MNTYSTSASFACPNNGDIDRYDIEIRSAKTIQVETILRVLSEVPAKIYQEDLASFLCSKLGAEVKVSGWHQGIFIMSVRQ